MHFTVLQTVKRHVHHVQYLNPLCLVIFLPQYCFLLPFHHKLIATVKTPDVVLLQTFMYFLLGCLRTVNVLFFFHEKIQRVCRSKLSLFTGEDLDQVQGACELARPVVEQSLYNSQLLRFPPCSYLLMKQVCLFPHCTATFSAASHKMDLAV